MLEVFRSKSHLIRKELDRSQIACLPVGILLIISTTLENNHSIISTQQLWQKDIQASSWKDVGTFFGFLLSTLPSPHIIFHMN